MNTSLFDLFRPGIGPSSSHTVGPMRAARLFVDGLKQSGALPLAARVRVELYGSLALTGRGHGIERGIVLGLCGERPETVDPKTMAERISRIAKEGELPVHGERSIAFRLDGDITFHSDTTLPGHPNGMRFSAYASDSSVVDSRVYYSIRRRIRAGGR
jgi:L-serine dehydratase